MKKINIFIITLLMLSLFISTSKANNTNAVEKQNSNQLQEEIPIQIKSYKLNQDSNIRDTNGNVIEEKKAGTIIKGIVQNNFVRFTENNQDKFIYLSLVTEVKENIEPDITETAIETIEETKKETKVEQKNTETNKELKNDDSNEEQKNSNVLEVMKKDDIKMLGRTNRQFLTFQTEEGSVYYLLVDYDENGIETNVDVLRKINDNDINNIKNLNTFNSDTTEYYDENTDEKIVTTESIDEIEENIETINSKEETSFLSSYGIYIIVFVVVFIAYFLKKKVKNKNPDESNYNESEQSENNKNQIEI